MSPSRGRRARGLGRRSTYLEELVCRLLVLLGHSGRGLAAESAHRGEQGEAEQDADGSVEDDLPVLIRGRLGAGAVGAEGDPVGYSIYQFTNQKLIQKQ